jgi:acyl-CoA synthetase (AMP-forming)/AMP-acid ligase II
VEPPRTPADRLSLRGLADVVVVGRPDERWGERVVAVVVGDVHEEQLREWAAARLAPARRPKEYLVVEEIPRSTTGKVRRQFLLRDLGAAG